MAQHLRRLESLSHPLWGHKISQIVVTCNLHKVIITAVAVQVVTDFSRQGQFHDYDSIILLPLETDFLYSNCMTCHSASGYEDLYMFPVRCCQSCWCYRYSCRLHQSWNLPFGQAYCIDNSFAGGFSTGRMTTWSWVDIEFIFRCTGNPVQGLVELFHLSKCTHVTTRELLNRFSWNLALENLRKIVELLQFSFM